MFDDDLNRDVGNPSETYLETEGKPPEASEANEPTSASLPQGSEAYPKVSQERFAYETKSSDRTDAHTLTIREAAKVLEQYRVPVTDRTVLNWCHPNKRGEFNLDCYYDDTEAKYFITSQSVEEAVQRERKKREGESPELSQTPHMPGLNSEELPKSAETPPNHSETIPKDDDVLPKDSEVQGASEHSARLQHLKNENRDLLITNRAKDMYITQLEKDREIFNDFIAEQGKVIGGLELQVKQLEAPSEHRSGRSRNEEPIEAEEARIGEPDNPYNRDTPTDDQ